MPEMVRRSMRNFFRKIIKFLYKKIPAYDPEMEYKKRKEELRKKGCFKNIN